MYGFFKGILNNHADWCVFQPVAPCTWSTQKCPGKIQGTSYEGVFLLRNAGTGGYSIQVVVSAINIALGIGNSLILVGKLALGIVIPALC